MGVLIVVIAFWAVVGGGVGAAIGNGKGRAPAGFWLGFFFGPVGWIIIAVMQATPEAEVVRMAAITTVQNNMNSSSSKKPTSTRDCPFCAETIKSAAILCRFCGRNVEPIVEVESGVQVLTGPKEPFSFLAEEFPASFDIVWDEALQYQPWPSMVTPLFRVACELVDKGLPVAQATRSAFLQPTKS